MPLNKNSVVNLNRVLHKNLPKQPFFYKITNNQTRYLRFTSLLLTQGHTILKINSVYLITMTQEEIFQKVQAIVAEQLSVDSAEVKSGSNFQNDLGADSLDTVELVMALEEAFDIEIPDEAAEGIATVGDAVKFIEEKKG